MLDDESVVPKREHDKVVEEREQYQALYLQTLERCRNLEQGILGQKSERIAGDNYNGSNTAGQLSVVWYPGPESQ